MKNKLIAMAVSAMIVCIGAVCAYGDTLKETVGEIEYSYSVTNGEATITGLHNVKSVYTYVPVQGDVVIPETLGGYPVVALGSYPTVPLYDANDITSLTFPDSFRTIERGNFRYCAALTNVTFGTGMKEVPRFYGSSDFQGFTVPADNPYFSAEGYVLYNKDKTTLVMCAADVEEFNVPSSVTTIGPSAFSEMDSLVSVTFHSGVREIGDSAFSMCRYLATLALPANLQVLGDCAFASCSSITDVTVVATVSRIGDSAFSNCTGLENLTIANGVKEIGPDAFYGCTGLEKVVVPNSVTNICGRAFEYCQKLSDVTIGSGVVKIGEGLGEPYVDEWGETYRDSALSAFGDCERLLDFKLATGNKVFEEIGGSLFLRATPNSAKTLAAYPPGRTNLYFTGNVNVTKIGDAACQRCCNFEVLDITNSVRDIGSSSFETCYNLRKVIVNPGVTNIAYGAFMLNMELSDVEIAGTVKTIGEKAFMHDWMPGDPRPCRLVLHEGIVEIGPAAFERSRDLAEVVIPDSVEVLGSEAFEGAAGLKRLTVGSGVTWLPEFFCASCNALSKVNIRGELMSICEGAFMYCESLADINLPSSLEFIGEDAFYQCYKLPYVSISADTIGPTAFTRCLKLARVDFTDNVREIGESAFSECSALRSVVIPVGVETIESGAFADCSNLGKVFLPQKFKGNIDTADVFAGCPLNDEDIIYYGAEGPAFVSATFMSQGETVETRQYVANTLDYLPRITADGLAFAGWYNAEEGGDLASDADLSGDVTFYARWIESPFVNTGSQEWDPSEDDAFPGEVVWRTVDVSAGGEASTSFEVVGPSVVSFSWKWSGSEDEDSLVVYVDGVEVACAPGEEWTKASVDVPESGAHLVTWSYARGQWSSDPETGNAWLADIRVVYGTAKTITFDSNGGTLAEGWDATRKVVSSLGELPFADKDGVAFAGWWTAAEGGERVTAATEPESDATYYARWVELPFTVSGDGAFWLAEDGSWAALRSDDGSSVTASVTLKGPCVVSFDWRHAADRWSSSLFRVDGSVKANLAKDEGWKSWTWSADDTEEHVIEWEFSGGWSYDPGQMFLKNISMGTPCEIAFDPGDDASIYMDDVDRTESGIFYVTRGGTLGHLPIPYSNRCLAFDGWYTAAEGGEKVTSETPVTGPATYYARWVESPVMTYWLRSWIFEPDGSLGSDNGCNQYNSSIVEKHLEGPGTLTFRWRMQSDSGNGYFSFLVTDPNITDYVETNRLTKSSGEWVTERYVFTDEAYTWVRWAYGVEGDRGGIERGWIKDVKWVSNALESVEWKVTFDANGGELDGEAERTVVDEFPIGKMPVVTKTDYGFTGWFTEAEGGEEVAEETPVTADMVVYAHWVYIEPVTPPEPPEPVDPFTAAGLEPSYTLQGGAAPDLAGVLATVAGDGWKIAVAGLPAGIKYDAAKNVLSGVASKEVVSEVTFTATKGTEKETAKSTFEVVYPTLTVVAAPGKDDPSATNGVKVAGGGKYALGAKVTLKATPAKTSVFMGWYLGEELVSQNASYAYVTTAEDVTFAAKFITVEEDKANISLAVNGAAIESAETPVATNVMCGVALEWPVAAGALSATTVKVAGLPAGLKFADKPVTSKVGTGKDAVVVTNVPANTIYGAPSAASKTTTDKKTGAVTVTPSDVKITVTTAGKSSVTYLVKLTVDPLPAWAVGNFEGVASDNSMPEYGPAAFSVTAAGKVSGKYSFLGTNWTFKADSYSMSLEVSGSRGFYVTANATSGKVVNEVVIVVVENSDCTILSGSAVSIGGGYVYDGPNRVAQISTYRLPWSDKDDKEASSLLASYAGAYTCTAAYGEVACPVVFTLDEKGVIKGTAEVLDGAKKRKVSFTSSALPMNDALNLLVVVPADLKKGYPALMCSATIHNFYAPSSIGHAYRDPGVVATTQAYSDPEASGTVTVSPKYGQVAAGKDVSLSAKADKGSVFYKWEITGLDTAGLDLSAATLKFKSPGTNDVFATAVFVKDTEDADSIGLAVGGVDLEAAGPTWSNYCGVAVNWDVEATALSATTVKATGLPAGLKLVQDKKTKAYTVAGVPTAASKAAKGSSELTPSPVKFTVTTAGKSSRDFTVNLVVLPLPAWAVGTFDGAVDGGGIVQALTIDAKGKVGGKILEDGKTWALTAASFSAVEGLLSDVDNLTFRATVVAKVNKEVVTNEVTVASADGVGVASSESWSAWQNLWKRADTKAAQPVFKNNIDVPLENGLKLTFKKDGVVAFAGTVDGAKLSGSSQLVWNGEVWKVTLYVPSKASFAGYCETFAVTLTVEANVVKAVDISEAGAFSTAWVPGEYVGYGTFTNPDEPSELLANHHYGMVAINVKEDLTFTGTFDLVDDAASASFSGKFAPFAGGGGTSCLAKDVEITVKGKTMLMRLSLIAKPFADKEDGYGDLFGGNEAQEGMPVINIVRAWHNVWKLDNLASERPTFAPSTSVEFSLAGHDFYSYTPGDYVDGDSLNFAFAEDGKKVTVTGQIFGLGVNTTSTIAVEHEGEGQCDCHVYFETNGHIYELNFSMPSSGTVTSGDISLPAGYYFGIING